MAVNKRVGASPTSDHDLLIRLDTKLDALTEQVKELTVNATARIATLEQDKISRGDLETQIKTCPGSTIHGQIINALSKKQEDHEKRLRFTERFVAGAVGVMTMIQVVANFTSFKEIFLK